MTGWPVVKSSSVMLVLKAVRAATVRLGFVMAYRGRAACKTKSLEAVRYGGGGQVRCC